MKKAAEQEGLLDGQEVLSLQAEVGGQWYWLKQEEKQEEPSALAAEFSLKQVSRTVHQGGGFLFLLMGIR